jgi:cation diffusion facilitator CzcD-associated flavoprotein CzcO
MRSDLHLGHTAATPVIVVGGGQSGLAAGWAMRELGLPALILEASDRAAGSWPRYYDSLRMFSPVEFSSMPGLPFPGTPGHYPYRDEVADYLEVYADGLGVEIQTNTRVETIHEDGRQFVVCTADGRSLHASGIVAATGSFANPYRPTIAGERGFTGQLLHVAEYRNPAPPTLANAWSSSVRATQQSRSPAILPLWQGLRWPRASPCASSLSVCAGKTSTTGIGRPDSTRFPRNG